MIIIMVILGIVGSVILGTGIRTWYAAVYSQEVVSTFFGLTFGITFMVIGGVLLAFDIALLIIYLVRRRNNRKNLTM